MIEEKCKICGRQVGLVSFITSIILGCFKLFIGIKSGSHALMASAFYSIQDVISTAFVFLGIRVSGKDADEKYPYGYGKIEYIISFVVSVGIIIGVLIVSYFAGRSVFRGPKSPGMLAFWCAVVSLVTTSILARYVGCSGNILNSPAIISSAQHIKADAISSLCVAVGIIFTKLGFQHIDPIIAIFEAIHITIISLQILRRGVNGLMDASLTDKENKKIEKIIGNVKGVRKIIFLRTRQLGQRKQIDCEVEIAGEKSLTEAVKIKKRIKSSIIAVIPQEFLINISIAPIQEQILENRQKYAKVIGVLRRYYNHYVNEHELNISKKRIKLSLNLLPKINDSEMEKFFNFLRKKIKEEIPDSEVIVEIL